MKNYFNSIKKGKVIACVLALSMVLTLVGCGGQNDADVSETDKASSAVSSEQSFTAEEAVAIYVGETEIRDVFLMKSSWDGEEYDSGYTLNRLMIEKYLSDDSLMPQAENKSILTFKFAGDVNPNSVMLIQQGNTFMSDTGMPYEIEPMQLNVTDSGDYQFEIQFGSLKMYYYQLECTWSNGNSAEYTFAVKKSK